MTRGCTKVLLSFSSARQNYEKVAASHLPNGQLTPLTGDVVPYSGTIPFINTYFPQYAPIMLPLVAGLSHLRACSVSQTPTVSDLRRLKVEPCSLFKE